MCPTHGSYMPNSISRNILNPNPCIADHFHLDLFRVSIRDRQGRVLIETEDGIDGEIIGESDSSPLPGARALKCVSNRHQWYT